MLRWQHDWGTKADHFEMLLGKGQRVPPGFLERPDILPVSLWHWSAFCDLESERPIGMAVGPIPRSAVRDYAIEHGIDDADGIADLWSIIARLDGEASRIRRVAHDPDEPLADKVSVQDAKGVKNLMRNIGRKKRK